MMALSTTNIQIRQGELGLTNTALAARCGISRQNISTIIRRGTCTPVTAAKLVKALEVPVADIIEKSG